MLFSTKNITVHFYAREINNLIDINRSDQLTVRLEKLSTRKLSG
jgi:hypothetical protein